MKNKITTAQDRSRNVEMGNSTSDKQFVETKTLKRHQGLPNLGARKNGSQKNNPSTDNE
ncbi:MAG: hypothetical protein ACI35V_00070 [Sphingobacterium composti]|uniref:hypothetical protein n=1 Tax=Sphingobacterium composti TaxID=363260 RepID=UPI00135CF64B|nr:hypothetical protein [Sphingobacterium composti Ten et al. 2007 non Yoo et al. 2007]